MEVCGGGVVGCGGGVVGFGGGVVGCDGVWWGMEVCGGVWRCVVGYGGGVRRWCGGVCRALQCEYFTRICA